MPSPYTSQERADVVMQFYKAYFKSQYLL
ncbi:hypothetical protein [Lysinibacillus contaminans]